MRPQLLDRLILPVLIPLGILAVIAFILITMSRILLAVGTEAATPVALTIALAILLTAVYLAGNTPSRGTLRALVGIPVVLLAIGGVWGQMEWNDKKGAHGEEEGVPGQITVSADNLEFDTKELHLIVGQNTIHFENADSERHNISIYRTPQAQDVLFEGEIIAGGATIDYTFTLNQPGRNYFQCDVHPAMNGEAIVEVAPVRVTADNLQFNTQQLSLVTGPNTVHLDNRDTERHNISIYRTSQAQDVLFEGAIIAGGATIDYTFTLPQPGDFYFQCDLHPTMNGTARVIAGGPPPGGGGPPPGASPSTR